MAFLLIGAKITQNFLLIKKVDVLSATLLWDVKVNIKSYIERLFAPPWGWIDALFFMP